MKPIETGTNDLLAHIDGSVGTIVLNRPERRNAMTLEMTQALGEVLADMDSDPEVGAVVLTGAGGAFCAGGDVKRFGDNGGDVPTGEMTADQWRQRRLDMQLHTVVRLREMTTPVLAALPGAVAGAGLGVALACDLRIGSDRTLITTAFVKIGLPGDFGVSWQLHHLVGPSRARRLMLLSERIDGGTALDLGLLDWLVPDGELAETAQRTAASIAAMPRPAVRAILGNLRDAAAFGLVEAMHREVDRYAGCSATAEHREAVAAFAAPREKGNT